MTRNQARLRGKRLRAQQINLSNMLMAGLVWLAAAGFLAWAVLWAFNPPY